MFLWWNFILSSSFLLNFNLKNHHISAQDTGLYEKQFLLSAERGDLESVRKLLEIYKSTKAFNINCLDPLRRLCKKELFKKFFSEENELQRIFSTKIKSSFYKTFVLLFNLLSDNDKVIQKKKFFFLSTEFFNIVAMNNL